MFLQKKILFLLVHNSEFLKNLIKNYCIRTHFDVVVCPAEGQERSRRSAGNTKKHKTCSQQKDTRIKRFWSKHFRQRNKTIFTEYDRKKSRLSSVNIILFLCLKAFTSQACYVPAFLLGTSFANLCAPWGRRVLVPALLPGTRRCGLVLNGLI